MIIQFNTNKTIEGEERLQSYYTSLIDEKLKRFESHLTRIEVHLTNENGDIEGRPLIQCVLEARMEGKQPIAVTAQSEVVEKAVSSAIEKLKSALDTVVGQLQSH